MHEMVEDKVFKKIRVYDYQGVCLKPVTTGSFASTVKPVKQIT